jgi:hypothetical protein
LSFSHASSHPYKLNSRENHFPSISSSFISKSKQKVEIVEIENGREDEQEEGNLEKQ